MNKEIIPAIIAKNQEEFSKNILKVKDFVNIIQLDFMDGMFVPNTSINFDFKIPETNCDFEAHLMINNPLDWIKENFDKVDTLFALCLSILEELNMPDDELKIMIFRCIKLRYEHERLLTENFMNDDGLEALKLIEETINKEPI